MLYDCCTIHENEWTLEPHILLTGSQSRQLECSQPLPLPLPLSATAYRIILSLNLINISRSSSLIQRRAYLKPAIIVRPEELPEIYISQSVDATGHLGFGREGDPFFVRKEYMEPRVYQQRHPTHSGTWQCVTDLPSNCMLEVAIGLILTLRNICRMCAIRVWVGLLH